MGSEGMAGEERMGPTADGRGKAFADTAPLAAETTLTLPTLLEGRGKLFAFCAVRVEDGAAG